MKAFSRAAAAMVLGAGMALAAPVFAEPLDLQLTDEDGRQVALLQQYRACQVRYDANPPSSVLDELREKAKEDAVDLKKKNAPDKVIDIWIAFTTSARFLQWRDMTCAAETKVDIEYLFKRSAEIKEALGEGGDQEFFKRLYPPLEPQ